MKSKIIFFVFLFAFLIRLIALNQSLWLDEAVTANAVKNLGFFQILAKFSPNDFHPPLYYLFMKLWTNIFGYSEMTLRFPSIIFSLLTGYFVYKIAKLLNGYIAGIWGAVFFLFNPLIIYYSQEARMYMMATMFLTIALYYFLKISNLKSQILFSLFIFLTLSTFYGSMFLIAAFLFYFIYKKQYKNLFISSFVMFFYFLIIFPLLYQQIINSKIALINVANWSLVLGKANMKNLLLIPVKFLIGRISFEPKWLYYLVAGGWTAIIITQISKLKSQNHISNRKSIFLFHYLFIFPLFLGFLVSFFTPLFQYFRFIYLIPIMSILLSFNLSQGHRLHRFGVAGGFIIFSLVYLLIPTFHREDWKSLVKSLPKDKPIYMITSSSDPVRYYNNNLVIEELTHSKLEKNIIVIPYTADIYGLDYKKIFEEKNYRLADKKTFRGLELDFFIFNN